MSSRTRRTPADLRDDAGSSLIVVVFVSFLLVSMVAVVLRVGEHAERASARSRNFDVALGVAEAGVHEAIAKIEASSGSYTGSFTGSVPGGTYSVTVSQPYGTFVVDASGEVAGDQLGRTRHVRATLGPPLSFPYALFSTTSVELKNNDTVTGDVWANDSVVIEENDLITGSVTAAQSWVQLKNGSRVTGDVWSGGFNAAEGWAIKLGNGAKIDGTAKASVSDPSTTCPTGGDYDVPMGGDGARVGGDLTTCDTSSGGSIGGTYTPNTFTQAAVPKAMPTFAFNPNNYDPATYHEFASAAEFQTWLAANGSSLQGTFYVDEPLPSQANRIDLTGVVVSGDVTIVTDAPVFTNGITDTVGVDKTFVVVSHYTPPSATACSVNHDSSECAVHIKNNFDASCSTAVLIYADNGPVAVKNNQTMCGTIAADAILIKNNQTINYDDRIERIVGFGATTYEIVRWEELSS